MTKSVLLFSGGLDSYIAYHYLHKPETVYFDLGTEYSEKEIAVVKRLVPETVIDTSLRFLGSSQEGPNAYVPLRNLYIAMAAITRHKASRVFLGGVKDDMVEDNNKEIMALWTCTLSKSGKNPVLVDSPFFEMTKADIVKWFASRHDVSKLLDTVSCYSGEDTTYCGKCPSCFRKAAALRHVGIKLPFTNEELVAYYRGRAEAGVYDPERNLSILDYLQVLDSPVDGVLEKKKAPKKIYVDIDGVLTNETIGHDYVTRTPNLSGVARVRALCANPRYSVTLFTARFESDRQVTEAWLRTYKVPYDYLILGKPQYDLLIDDKAYNDFEAAETCLGLENTDE